MKIMLDMDEVICHLFDPLIKEWNALKGTNFTLEDFNSWDIADTFFGKEGEIWAFEKMNQQSLYDTLPPVEGAIETIQQLMQDGHEVIIVSAVPETAPNTYVGKVSWIKRHMPFFPFANFFTGKRKHLIYAHVQFDDGAHNLKEFPGIAVAMDRPWNRKYKAMYRVKTWKEFYEIITDLNTPKYKETPVSPTKKSS